MPPLAVVFAAVQAGAVGVLLGFGSWVHVLDPPELRELMVQIADEARSLYAVPDRGA